jgi:hypothetical protein
MAFFTLIYTQQSTIRFPARYAKASKDILTTLIKRDLGPTAVKVPHEALCYKQHLEGKMAGEKITATQPIALTQCLAAIMELPQGTSLDEVTARFESIIRISTPQWQGDDNTTGRHFAGITQIDASQANCPDFWARFLHQHSLADDVESN